MAGRKQKEAKTPKLDEYVPKRKSKKLGRERPVTGYLDPDTREAFDKYLDAHGLGTSECLRWLIVDAIRNKRVPPG